MKYEYRQYYHFYLAAIVLLVVFLVIRMKNIIDILFSYELNKIVVFFTAIQIFAIPLLFCLLGVCFRKILIETDNNGISYSSPFKNVSIKWEEIDSVTKTGGWVKIRSSRHSFVFNVFICCNHTLLNRDLSKLSRECLLLNEVKNKASKAIFLNI